MRTKKEILDLLPKSVWAENIIFTNKKFNKDLTKSYYLTFLRFGFLGKNEYEWDLYYLITDNKKVIRVPFRQTGWNKYELYKDKNIVEEFKNGKILNSKLKEKIKENNIKYIVNFERNRDNKRKITIYNNFELQLEKDEVF